MLDDQIPELNIEQIDDGKGEGLILLEQDSGGNVERVAIHPIHLRFLAEKYGLAETCDPQAEKTIATLKRRMRVLRDRVSQLDGLLAGAFQGAGPNHVTAYSEATKALAEEFCDEGSPESGLVPNRDGRRDPRRAA